ncbi:MAG: hypothetical protein LBF40_07520 [Deltaproteobacteria bacterium]|nr:hypothetical protein [Deltaproteobacteria bacterium]
MPTKMSRAQASLNKLMRYALGVQPDEFGLVLAADGSITAKELASALREEDGFRGMTEQRIKHAVLSGDLGTFELEGDLVRLSPKLASLPPARESEAPLPKELFIALKESAWAAVSEKGLRPKRPKDDCVRLFVDQGMALRVGARSQKDPLLVRVAARKAESSGTKFTPYGNAIWLTEGIAKEFLFGPKIRPEDAEKAKAAKDKEKPSGAMGISTDSAMLTAGIVPARPQASHGKKKGKYSDSPEWKTQARKDRRGKGSDRGKRDKED